MYFAYKAYKKHRARKAAAAAQAQAQYTFQPQSQSSQPAENPSDPIPTLLQPNRPQFRENDSSEPEFPQTATQAVAAPNTVSQKEAESSWTWKKIWNECAVVMALFLPVFLETLDYTVVATAQPTIASYFNRLDLQSYIGTIYLLTSTVFLPLYATLADVFGRHLAMQTAMLFFILGSAISTGAQNITMVLAGRGLSGIGAAGVLAVTRILLSDSASLNSNNRLGFIFIILYTPGYCVGPTIGGALTSKNWRWVFGINLPIAFVSMIIIFLILPAQAKGPQLSHFRTRILARRRALATRDEPKSTDSSEDTDSTPTSTDPKADSTNEPTLSFTQKILSIDFPGAILFIAGFILFLLALNWGSTFTQWNTPRVIACFVVGGVLVLSSFVWEEVLERRQKMILRSDVAVSHVSDTGDVMLESGYEDARVQKKSRGRALKEKMGFFWEADPMIPLSVFKSYDVCATLFAALGAGMVMFVLFYFVSIFLTIVTGYSPFKAGLQLIYFTPGLAGGSWVASILIKVLRQPKYPCILGSTIITISLGFIARAVDHANQSQINGFMVMAGVGVGMTFGPLAMHARFSQPESRVAIVVALNLFARTIGGTFGLTQCATILNSKVNSYLSAFFRSHPGDISALSSISSLSAGSVSSIATISSFPPEVQDAVRQAFRRGVYWCFISLIPWNGLATIGTLFLSLIPDTDKGDSLVADPHDGKRAPVSQNTKGSENRIEEVKDVNAEDV